MNNIVKQALTLPYIGLAKFNNDTLKQNRDWKNRKNYLTDGKECVIFHDMQDLNDKIDYYLRNEEERNAIAQSGYNAVQKFNRLNWARKIIELSYD